FVLTRFDYTISNKDSFSANYTISDGERDSPQADSYYTQFVALRNQTLGLQETHVLSPSVVNFARLGWVRPYAAQIAAPNGSGAPVPANLIFLPGGNPGSIAIGGGLTSVGAAPVAPAPGNNPYRNIREYYSLSDDLRFTKGRHSFSTGVWVQRIH